MTVEISTVGWRKKIQAPTRRNENAPALLVPPPPRSTSAPLNEHIYFLIDINGEQDFSTEEISTVGLVVYKPYSIKECNGRRISRLISKVYKR